MLLLHFFNDTAQDSTSRHTARFSAENVLARLRAVDENARPQEEPLAGIGMELNAAGRVTKNSYGVFNLSWQARERPEWAEMIAAEASRIRQRIKDAHGVPLRFVIWAGMGGSVEDKSMYQAMGLLKSGPRLYSLDSTDPAKLKAILADIEQRSKLPLADVLKSTLVVGMAMGMTSYEPVVNLEKLSALYDRHGIDSRPNFIYLTLPGSLLDRFAGPRGYRRVEIQPDDANTTAGRHSAPLTRGSLYPLALARHDLKAWIEGTFLDAEEISLAWSLSAFLHTHGEAGRDKVTLLLPKEWRGAALWTKQDFEESLGKSEALGIKIVIGEKPRAVNYRSPKDPLQDRIFLAVQVKGSAGPEEIPALRRARYPLAVVTLPKSAPVSRYMQFIHYVVFGLGYLRGMNFVTQPSVELYKSIANRLHEEARKAGGIANTPAWREIPSAVPDPGGRTAAAYGDAIRRLAGARQFEYGELTFFGDTRYHEPGRAMRKLLDRAGERIFRSSLKMPVDIYEGPAMNHSYHEMIIGHGRCFSTVLISARQERLAEAGYDAEYHMAQFLATKLALEQRGRTVFAFTVRDLSDRSLAALEEFFAAAAARLR